MVASQYGLTLEQAGWEMPLAAALALYEAATTRLGFELKGGGYAMRASLRAREMMQRSLESTYTLVDGPWSNPHTK
jgi:hypothetical protein